VEGVSGHRGGNDGRPVNKRVWLNASLLFVCVGLALVGGVLLPSPSCHRGTSTRSNLSFALAPDLLFCISFRSSIIIHS